MCRVACVMLLLCLRSPAQGSPQELMQQALEAQNAGRFETAVRDYRLLLRRYPEVFEIHSNLGVALAGEGSYGEAITEYQQALTLRADPQVRLNLALAYYKAGNLRLAVDMLRRAHMERPGDLQITTLLSDCYLNLGENKEVVALLQPVQRAQDDDALTYLLGTALVRDGQAAEGQIVIDKILKRTNSAESLLLMGTTKYMAGNFAGAREDLRKAVELNPELPDTFAYYGMALLSIGERGEARKAFERELQQNPNDFVSNLHMGVLLQKDQDYAGALRYLQHALQMRPDDPGVRFEIASIELVQGHLQEATRDLEALVRDSPGLTEAHWALATIYLRGKRTADAKREREIAGRLKSLRHGRDEVVAQIAR